MTPTARASGFCDLGLIEPLIAALTEQQHVEPSPLQTRSIPPLLRGRDLLGCAHSDAGKTAAFVLPILQRLSQPEPRVPSRSPRALVLVPTPERAARVVESFVAHGRHLHPTVVAIHGGVGRALQMQELARGVDVAVATPARLLDLLDQGHARLDRIEVLVLDEADQMLDLGTMPAVERILAAIPVRRQTLLFSATMPPPITALADRVLVRPVKVVMAPAATARAVRLTALRLARRTAGAR
jgi:ATP-dependent RNA helicase RhlE